MRKEALCAVKTLTRCPSSAPLAREDPPSQDSKSQITDPEQDNANILLAEVESQQQRSWLAPLLYTTQSLFKLMRRMQAKKLVVPAAECKGYVTQIHVCIERYRGD